VNADRGGGGVPNGFGTMRIKHFPCAVQIVDLFHARPHLLERRDFYTPAASRVRSNGSCATIPNSIGGKIEKLEETIRIEAAYFERRRGPALLPL
jgi:hypothetical protein